MALCSVACVMMWLPFFLYIAATPLIARLLLSVAPLVKMISFAVAPIKAAICSRRFLDGLFRFPAERVVAAGGVAVLLGEVRQHRLDHARIGPRRRVVVHVDRHLHRHRFEPPGVILPIHSMLTQATVSRRTSRSTRGVAKAIARPAAPAPLASRTSRRASHREGPRSAGCEPAKSDPSTYTHWQSSTRRDPGRAARDCTASGERRPRSIRASSASVIVLAGRARA